MKCLHDKVILFFRLSSVFKQGRHHLLKDYTAHKMRTQCVTSYTKYTMIK